MKEIVSIMAKEIVVTRKGLQDLQEELDNLKSVKRKEVADKIKVARGYGDLSENAEYDAAKEEQAFVEARIADLEAMVKTARVIDDSELNLDTVAVGMHVVIREPDCDPEEYDITGSTESDVNKGKISDESPIGKSLLGHHVGDLVEVPLPNGNTITFEVMEIRRSSL